MNLHLNVGLNRNDGKAPNTILRTVAVLNQCGFLIYNADIQQSDTEPTLCATVQHVKAASFLDYDLHNVASRLAQDCIAALTWSTSPLNPSVGSLHGPDRDKWGEFNPDLFLRPQLHQEYAA